MTPGKVTITSDAQWLRVEFAAEGIEQPGHALFVALVTDPLSGCAVLPYQQHAEGSTVFLPFRANRLYAVRSADDGQAALWWREWTGTKWSGHMGVDGQFRAQVEKGKVRMLLSKNAATPLADAEGLAVWLKDTRANDGWGATLGFGGAPGDGIQYGDVALPRQGDVRKSDGERLWRKKTTSRPRIYQLLPRLFSNTNETRKPNGTLEENGVGKFADINDAALKSLRDEMGVTHLWLTGVLAQATSTDYSAIGKPADDPDLLKGLAGSPYAIKDYGDVCADYALEPEKRMEEFTVLVGRIHAAGLRMVIDLVANHVARSHASKLVAFGAKDDTARFFSPQNNFFWLQHDSPGGGPPLRLPTFENGQPISPTCRVLGAGDGRFEPETTVGRVTGNNSATWSPSANDWYETVKLNYGYDFTTGARAYPHGERPDEPIPDTWLKMDAVLAHWQTLGVDGFRCDMAHMVPPEFWGWAIARARVRQPGVYFVAEAYNNDPAKVEGGYDLLAHFHNVMIELLNAGFDTVYDDPSYKALKAIYDGHGWANDLDAALGFDARGVCTQPYVFQNSLRYAENHDEVRLASRGNWGGIGMEVGRPVAGILTGISHGPAFLYSGQEVGEPAAGAEGFGGDSGRTSIFDYWAMPELAKWVNGHRYDGARLSPQQKALRQFYGKLLHLVGEPAFRDGEFYPLNGANKDNAAFGRLDENASGHWLYAYVRADAPSGSRFLVVANLHRSETLRDVRVCFSPEAFAALGRVQDSVQFLDRLSGLAPITVPSADFRAESGITIPALPPLTTAYFEAMHLNQ